MEPSNNNYPTPSKQNSQPNLHRLANWLIILGVMLGAWFLFSATLGYGTLQIEVPNHSKVLINGNPVASKSVHLRTGSYEIEVYSPTTKPSAYDVRVWLWGAKFTPELPKRSPKAIVASSIGASGLYGVPSVSDVKWFNSDTWFAGLVGPGSTAPIALQWQEKAWKVAYLNVGDYPNNVNDLPDEVASYIKKLEVGDVQ